MANRGGDGRKDGRTDGRLEIPPCVLQDIGPLGPLPKKEDQKETRQDHTTKKDRREERAKKHSMSGQN